MRSKFLVAFLCLALIFSNNLFSVDFWSDIPNEQLAEELVGQMTNEELLAQILMFGWAGSEPSELLLDWITTRSLGSVKVYGWGTDNTDKVAKSVTLVQQKAQNCRFKIPLYVATDQEGGIIRHIKGSMTDTPGNFSIGASGYPIDAYYTGYYIAKELRALGVNINFAPTVDSLTNPKSTLIATRSFGSDPEKIAALSTAFVAGTIKAGVIPTAKHFPGHGDTSTDSHGAIPIISIDKQTLDNRELVPYKALIAHNVPAIMSGHLSFPKIISSGEPASLSKKFITDILRNELHFTGLIITDDMMMNGATLYTGSLSEAVRLAIEAGNDIVIFSTTAKLYDPLWTNNLRLLSTSKSFYNTVRKTAKHVILSKLEYFKGANSVPIYPDLTKLDELIPDPEAEAFILSQACRSITLEKNGNLPLQDSQKILFASQYQSFLASAKKRFSNANSYYFNYTMGPNALAWTFNQISKTCDKDTTIVITVVNADSAKLASLLTEAEYKVILISLSTPNYIKDNSQLSQNATTVIHTYSYSHFSFTASIAVLAGDFIPQGKLPL